MNEKDRWDLFINQLVDLSACNVTMAKIDIAGMTLGQIGQARTTLREMNWRDGDIVQGHFIVIQWADGESGGSHLEWKK